jgi:hypothetical protein
MATFRLQSEKLGKIMIITSLVIFMQSAPKLSYTGMVTDVDLYVLAVNADLATFRSKSGLPKEEWLEESRSKILELFKKRTTLTKSGGWILEKGKWDDHPDYINADENIEPGLKKKPKGISFDSSHFSRVPLFLVSYAGADRTDGKYYDQLRSMLGAQFSNVVVVPSNSSFRFPRVTNYMDGRNGYYRLGYKDSKDKGYGPFQLSGTTLYGWWTFCEDPKVQDFYREVNAKLPMKPDEEEGFLGPFRSLNINQQLLLTYFAAEYGSDALARSNPFQRIWNRTVAKELSANAWDAKLAESAQYTLMLPMHVAFRYGWRNEKDQFHRHFERFQKAGIGKLGGWHLTRLHYLYFVSRYLVLAAQAGETNRIAPGLANAVETELRSMWSGPYRDVLSHTGWNEPEFRDFSSYLDWKLSQK